MSVIYINKSSVFIGSQTVSLKVVITPPRAKPTWLNSGFWETVVTRD